MKPSYFPQLDGVRGIAILIVMGGHFLPLPRHANLLASLGVELFFCLSGFLITRILLALPHRNGRESRHGLGTFYARRVLRIFPIYYLTIVAAALASAGPPREHFLRLATYTVGVPGLPGLSLGEASHLWSLSMEEQFYLVWPFVIVYLPRRFLHGAILGTIALGFAFKTGTALMPSINAGLPGLRSLPGCMGTLGLGALLALYLDDARLGKKGVPALLAVSRFVGWPCLVLLAAWRIGENIDIHAGDFFGTALLLSAGAFAAVGLIHFALENRRGLLGTVLSFPPLVFVGKISYGLYLYHYFMISAVAAMKPHLPVPLGARATILAEVAASFAVALLSWYLIERPILGLKRNFAYGGRRRGTEAAIG